MKKILSALLAGVILLFIPAHNAFAASDSNTRKIIVSEEHAKQQSKSLRDYGESEVITVLSTEYQATTVTPSGQLPGGTRVSTGGGFYVNTSGGPVMSVNFGLSWGGVSAGVSIGYASTKASVGDIYLSAPTTTEYYMVKITKTLKFERHLVDIYQYGEYKYSYYNTVYSVYRQDAYLVKA